jgi:hypothetical protein
LLKPTFRPVLNIARVICSGLAISGQMTCSAGRGAWSGDCFGAHERTRGAQAKQGVWIPRRAVVRHGRQWGTKLRRPVRQISKLYRGARANCANLASVGACD